MSKLKPSARSRRRRSRFSRRRRFSSLWMCVCVRACVWWWGGRSRFSRRRRFSSLCVCARACACVCVRARCVCARACVRVSAMRCDSDRRETGRAGGTVRPKPLLRQQAPPPNIPTGISNSTPPRPPLYEVWFGWAGVSVRGESDGQGGAKRRYRAKVKDRLSPSPVLGGRPPPKRGVTGLLSRRPSPSEYSVGQEGLRAS